MGQGASGILINMGIFNLSFDGRGQDLSSIFSLFFLLKNPPLDHTLRPFKLLILALLYHKKKFLENII